MSTLGLFLQSLFASWMVWIGGIFRFVPFIDKFFESRPNKYPKTEKFLKTHSQDLKRIALLCAFIACFRAWTFEHKNAQNAMYGRDGKSEAWAKYNQCDKERAVDDTLAKSCSSNLSFQQSRNDSQQDLFNRCMLSLGLKAAPEPTKIAVHRWKFPAVYTYPNVGQVQFWVLVAIVNKPTPARGTLKCDAPFKALTSTLLSHGNVLKADYEQKDDNTVHVEYAYPLWSYQNPLVFDAYTTVGKEINSCSFSLD